MSDPFLTREEEAQLFVAYRQSGGDKKIEARLLESQLGLVGRLTAAYWRAGVDRRDLFQEGALGLLRAIRRFDPARGVRLATYAAHWIHAYALRFALANRGRPHDDDERLERIAGHELPADEAVAAAEAAAIVRQERDRFRQSLDARHRALFDARWMSESAPTLKSMGAQLGVSRERARQLERRMLDQLGDRVGPRLAA
jgi:RNA polymerase sigma factor (sigma-70 family)